MLREIVVIDSPVDSSVAVVVVVDDAVDAGASRGSFSAGWRRP